MWWQHGEVNILTCNGNMLLELTHVITVTEPKVPDNKRWETLLQLLTDR